MNGLYRKQYPMPTGVSYFFAASAICIASLIFAAIGFSMSTGILFSINGIECRAWKVAGEAIIANLGFRAIISSIESVKISHEDGRPSNFLVEEGRHAISNDGKIDLKFDRCLSEMLPRPIIAIIPFKFSITSFSFHSD